MARYFIEPRIRKYLKGCGFLQFARILFNKYGKQSLKTASKTGLDALKTSYQKNSPENC